MSHPSAAWRRCIAALALAGAMLCAHAAGPCLDRPIRFSHYEFGLLHSDGHGGIDDDLQMELERRTGCKFVVDTRARARIWSELEAGSLDMAASGVQNPQRDTFAWFEHYVLEDNQMHLGPKVPASVNSMAEFLKLPSLTMGGVRSYSYSPFYDKQIEELVARKRHFATVDPDMMVRMFAAGRFDAFLGSQLLSLHYFKLQKAAPPRRIVDWDAGPPTPSGLVISKKSFTPEQGAQWQALVVELIRDGTIREILIRHLGQSQYAAVEYAPPGKPTR